MSDGLRRFVGDFGLDMDELEAAFNDKTRVLILNTPHNPTGKVGPLAGILVPMKAYKLQ